MRPDKALGPKESKLNLDSHFSLSQESQLQALGPAIQESLLRVALLLLVCLTLLSSLRGFPQPKSVLPECLAELLLPSPSRHTFVNVASFVSAVLVSAGLCQSPQPLN